MCRSQFRYKHLGGNITVAYSTDGTVDILPASWAVGHGSEAYSTSMVSCILDLILNHNSIAHPPTPGQLASLRSQPTRRCTVFSSTTAPKTSYPITTRITQSCLRGRPSTLPTTTGSSVSPPTQSTRVSWRQSFRPSIHPMHACHSNGQAALVMIC